MLILNSFKLEIFNLLGENIKTLYNGIQNPQKIYYRFSAKDSGFGPGIFTVKLSINETVFIKRIIELE